MKKTSITAALLISLITAASALAGTYKWTSGWGMGVSEYLVDDGNGNELNISCPDDEERYIRAYATIAGKKYDSHSEARFDVIVDGEHYSNPFYTECRVCSANFKVFWSALRNANNLFISADGKTVRLPVQDIKENLPPLDNHESTCRYGW